MEAPKCPWAATMLAGTVRGLCPGFLHPWTLHSFLWAAALRPWENHCSTKEKGFWLSTAWVLEISSCSTRQKTWVADYAFSVDWDSPIQEKEGREPEPTRAGEPWGEKWQTLHWVVKPRVHNLLTGGVHRSFVFLWPGPTTHLPRFCTAGSCWCWSGWAKVLLHSVW